MIDFNLQFDYGDGDTMYLTHSLHPYPAKFPPLLPKTLLEKYGTKGQTVLVYCPITNAILCKVRKNI